MNRQKLESKPPPLYEDNTYYHVLELYINAFSLLRPFNLR